MTDFSFPARIRAHRQRDVDGLPIITADVEVAREVATLPLPAGPIGPEGPAGRAKPTFVRMGSIANQAERPGDLGAEDRGKWWHRLDNNAMDVWTGTGWMQSPGAVGPQGPVAEPNQINVAHTLHDEKLTEPGVQFSGSGATQQLTVTVPAGMAGPAGPPGQSGPINAAADFDAGRAPTAGSVFAYDRGTRKYRPQPTPLGTGPWSWYQSDFNATQTGAVDKIIAGTFTVPAQVFDWRPVVHGHLFALAAAVSGLYAVVTVRLLHSEGPIVAGYRLGWNDSSNYLYVPLSPLYGDSGTSRTMSPTSTYGVVPAGQAADLVVVVERHGVASTSSGNIGFHSNGASLVVFAEPALGG